MNEDERKEVNGQDIEDFASEMRNENRMMDEKEKEIEEFKKLYTETKDLNEQYFENIIKLLRIRGNLIILCAFELIVIIALVTYIL